MAGEQSGSEKLQQLRWHQRPRQRIKPAARRVGEHGVRGQELDGADQHPQQIRGDQGWPESPARTPVPGEEAGKQRFGEQRVGHRLRRAEQQLRSGQQSDGRERQSSPSRGRSRAGRIHQPQDPGEVGDHSLIIGIDCVQNAVGAERVTESAEQRGRGADVAAQEDEQPGEQQRDMEEHFQRERRVERQPAVQQQVKRMVGPVLAFAGEEDSAVHLRHPVERVPGGEAATVERPDGQVEQG